MSRQYKNGRCTCWAKCDKELVKHGTRLATAFSFSGKHFLELGTERTDGRRKPAKRIVCSYCPFCGAKLK
jgi:hypothetical protein